MPDGSLKLLPPEHQPITTFFALPDGVAVVAMAVDKAGTIIPQHVHKYDHSSFLAMGRVKVWKDDVEVGEFTAPCNIVIAAGHAHRFETLEDGTMVFCIHNIARTGEIEILAENNLV